ncbi:hypothetical protein Agub_g8160 [Astrephomene gubernaculifera]|uniref:PAS domain-containing protein n=1 Tax=Astrephomene gubernaculifera TaxID=47775 RepID=A0AAD3HMV1_9CHLO|nr:hypothetical protein Agub_g8160 [Astrephomene gubernaculifera]
MVAKSIAESSYAGSGGSSASTNSRRVRVGQESQDGQGENLLERRSSLENGIFGVLFTLSKENSESHIRIRWVLVKILLDGWQLFTTVISPAEQGWAIKSNGMAWSVVSVLNFTWLADLGYGAYIAVLYLMLTLLAVNVGMCVWVAWCFKEQKFPVVWPIMVLRIFSSVFFQAFDVASLNLLQLGISCRYTGYVQPHLHFNLFPQYSCSAAPHILHAIVSGLCLMLFVAIALLLNMAEVEVNPKSRRPLALGHSGAELAAFAIKVLLTLVNVFFGWRRVAACCYLALSLALVYQYLRWSPHLVAWVNYLKTGVSTTVVWCAATLMLLVFEPGVKQQDREHWSKLMTVLMLSGLAPAFGAGVLMSRTMIRHLTNKAFKSVVNAPPECQLMDLLDVDGPRDIEIIARCCRVWKDMYTLEPDGISKALHFIKAGLARFPASAYMVLLHANFMIDVLGVSQSGSRRIEDARKLNPGLMCRFIMFVRQQQATQKAAGHSANDGANMDLLGYVEYQRKQRMVIRLHREALQAMCNFWKALDMSTVSFTQLSKALGKIESSVSQAQTAYRVVLESYGNNPKLVRLYGKFLQNIKNDPWGAAEYFAEADRLEEVKNNDSAGPLLPDGTPLGRMDEMDVAVLVLNSTGDIQMANRQTHHLFGYKRGYLESKPLSTLLAPHYSRRLSEQLASLVATGDLVKAGGEGRQGVAKELMMLGMHSDRLAFPVKLSLRKATGVGEDSTILALMEPLPPAKNRASLWVAPNGSIVACDPQFVANFGWKPAEVHGANVTALIVTRTKEQLLADAAMALAEMGDGVALGEEDEEEEQDEDRIARMGESACDLIKRLQAISTGPRLQQGLQCYVTHKYDEHPITCMVSIFAKGAADLAVHELRIRLTAADPTQLLVVDRKGVIAHASSELVASLGVGIVGAGAAVGAPAGAVSAVGAAGANGSHGHALGGMAARDLLHNYALTDFLPPPWKDMHVKYMKDITALSPASRSLWTCRKMPPPSSDSVPAGSSPPPGPTLELRTASGSPLFMRVSVATLDKAGEPTHVIRLARSSLGAALDERRMRLSVSPEGVITAASKETPPQLFGLEPQQFVGQRISDIIEETSPASAVGTVKAPATPSVQLLNQFVSRALSQPGCSWRVRVLAPAAAAPAALTSGMLAELSVTALANMTKDAVMVVHVELPYSQAAATSAPTVHVDLWPTTSLTAVLELNASGRVNAVLEERTRPAGLLFGVPTQSLVGSMLSGLVTLPPGRSSPSELLSLHGAKKSSLKADNKEASVKVGPLHVLQGAHSDGRPLVLDVQMVGKPGPNQPVTAILRVHAAPMMPGIATATLVPAAPTVNITQALDRQSSSLMKGLPTGGSVVAGAARISLPPPPKTSSSRAGTAAGGVRTSAVLISQGSRLSLPPADKAETPSPRLNTPSPDVGVSRTGTATAVPDIAATAGDGFKQSKRSSGLDPDKPEERLDPKTPVNMTDGLEAKVNLDALCVVSPGVPIAATNAGDSTAMEEDAGAPSSPAPAPAPADLLADTRDGDPPPGVAADNNTATQQVERTVLSELVMSAVVDGAGIERSGGSSSASGRVRHLLSRGGEGESAPRLPRPGSRLRNTTPGSKAGIGAGSGEGMVMVKNMGLGFGKTSLPGTPSEPIAEEDMLELRSLLSRGASAAQDLPGSGVGLSRPSLSEGSDSEQEAGNDKVKETYGALRISAWVESKGAFYQNAVGIDVKSDDGKSVDDDGASPGRGSLGTPILASTGLRPAGGQTLNQTTEGAGIAKVPMRPGPMGLEEIRAVDDDAASEGGQSAMSGQSGSGGAEYKRGRRYRKLVKLMDSSQAQQVQKIFRTRALGTVALLASVHVICFVLTVIAIQSQRTRMLQLSRAGEWQRYMHQILLDVRSLDVISKNKTIPWLYTKADAPTFVDRIATDAEELKVRLNEIIKAYHDPDSPMLQLFFYETSSVWNANEADGSDQYTNLTTWDFSTRFYAMAKNIEQYYEDWVRDGVYIADTAPGQFLLKSGPDVFDVSRKILDALLYVAVDNARWVEGLQFIFLAVEGAAISCLSAFYLAYLLRAVATQRYKLYGIFLIIPVGLTRALSSQNANLDLDEDEEEDDDEDEVPTAHHEAPEGEGDGGAPAVQKLKRRATLKLATGPDGSTPSAGGLGKDKSLRSRNTRGGDTGGVDRMPSRGEAPDKRNGVGLERTLTGESMDGSWWASLFSCCQSGQIWRQLVRRSRSTVTPLPQSNANGGGSSPQTGGGKRVLKYNSNETIFMITPFIVWSVLVITIYAIAVVMMRNVVEVVAVHSVSNFLSARTLRTVFFCQEVAIVEDPSQLLEKRATLFSVMKLVKDAWYTLQLGKDAYKAAGPDTEVFPLVKTGLVYSTPGITDLFYGTGACLRTGNHLPCPDSDYRFYRMTHSGLDSMMQQFILSLSAMATNQSLVPEGLEDEHFDYVYSVGSKDLLDGTTKLVQAHYTTLLDLFSNIMVLHIVLFLMLWVVFICFLVFLLNPLIKRTTKERRRIAELMSQLPLELDVEKLVARALGTAAANNSTAPGGAPGGGGGSGGPGGGTGGPPDRTHSYADLGDESVHAGTGAEATKWKAIIRAASSLSGKMPQGSITRRRSSFVAPQNTASHLP